MREGEDRVARPGGWPPAASLPLLGYRFSLPFRPLQRKPTQPTTSTHLSSSLGALAVHPLWPPSSQTETHGLLELKGTEEVI